jgi:hypothetical protein
MSTLQTELSSIGAESYTTFIQNKTDGSSYQFAYQVSNVVTDSSQCRVSFHWKLWQNGTAMQDRDAGFSLHDVTSVVDEPIGLRIAEQDAANGQPILNTSTTPPVMVLVVHRSDGAPDNLPFTDAALANRTAATLKQAVKLCGGTLAN